MKGRKFLPTLTSLPRLGPTSLKTGPLKLKCRIFETSRLRIRSSPLSPNRHPPSFPSTRRSTPPDVLRPPLEKENKIFGTVKGREGAGVGFVQNVSIDSYNPCSNVLLPRNSRLHRNRNWCTFSETCEPCEREYFKSPKPPGTARGSDFETYTSTLSSRSSTSLDGF